MNPRSMAVLIAVALLLGVFVYFYQIRGGEQRREVELAATRIFPGIEASDIEAVWLYAGHTVTRANRGEGGWQLVSPVEFPADDTVLEGIASAFAQMTHESVIEEPQEPSVYGLGPGALVIYFSADGEDHGLRLGNKAPVGSSQYVVPASADPAERVYTIASWRVNAIQKDLDAIRDKRVLDFDREQVERLELSWPEGGVELRKTREGWQVVRPIDDAADQSTIDRLLSDLAFMRAESFDDEPQPDSHTGLDQPGFKAVIHLAAPADGQEGQANTRTIEIASFSNGPLRLVRGAYPSLYKVTASRLDDFPRDLLAYRFKQLGEFSVEEAYGLELRFQPEGRDSTVIEAEKGEGGWSGGDPPISAERAARLVEELSRLEAIDIVADKLGDGELAGLGLDPPRVALLVFSEKDKRGYPKLLSEVQLGISSAERGITARRGDGRKVYRLAWDLAEFLPVSLDAYRARFVASDVPDDNAARETVEALPASVD